MCPRYARAGRYELARTRARSLPSADRPISPINPPGSPQQVGYNHAFAPPGKGGEEINRIRSQTGAAIDCERAGPDGSKPQVTPRP